MADRLERVRHTLLEDPVLRAEMGAWAKARVLALVERHHGRLAGFIENGVRALGPALALWASRIDRHTRFGRSAMPAKRSQVDYVVIADKQLDDYGPLVIELSKRGVRVGLFSAGEEALRAANGNAATLWVVNVTLPDMTGVALLKLVRRRLARSTVFLVGDEYSADDELAARAAPGSRVGVAPPRGERRARRAVAGRGTAGRL